MVTPAVSVVAYAPLGYSAVHTRNKFLCVALTIEPCGFILDNCQSKSPRLAEAFTLVTPAGVEPAIFWMRTRRPGPLDEGAGFRYAPFYINQLSFVISENDYGGAEISYHIC